MTDRLRVVNEPGQAPLGLEDRARSLRSQANQADREIAEALLGDLSGVASRCDEVGDFLGIPDRERSELRHIGVHIRRALEAIDNVRAKRPLPSNRGDIP